jgi:hypothetical protein
MYYTLLPEKYLNMTHYYQDGNKMIYLIRCGDDSYDHPIFYRKGDLPEGFITKDELLLYEESETKQYMIESMQRYSVNVVHVLSCVNPNEIK